MQWGFDAVPTFSKKANGTLFLLYIIVHSLKSYDSVSFSIKVCVPNTRLHSCPPLHPRNEVALWADDWVILKGGREAVLVQEESCALLVSSK